MASSDLYDAFDDCINRLNAGQSVEDCLRAYPHYAAALRPMLEAGLALRRAVPATPAGARNRVRARVIRTRAPRWQSFRQVRAAAAVLAVVFLTALIALWLNRADDRLRVEPIPTVAQASPTLTLTTTPTVTTTSTLTTTPTLTQTPTSTPTETPTGTATPSPTPTETATERVDPPPTSPALSAPDQSTTSTPTLAPECRFTITVSSANKRSGPGTGYNILGFAYSGDEFVVLARHASADWLEIATADGSAWIATSTGELSGECAALPVSDMPIIAGSSTGDDNGGDNSGPSGGEVTAPADPGTSNSGSGGSSSGSDDSGGDDEEKEKEKEPEPEPPDDD